MQMRSIIRVPRVGSLQMLSDFLAGSLGTSVARLYTNNVPYSPTDVLSTFVEAAFPGYTPLATAPWSTPGLNTNGQGETDSRTLTWTYASPAGSVPCYGVYLTDPANTKLYLVLPFITPYLFSPRRKNLVQVVRFTLVSQV